MKSTSLATLVGSCLLLTFASTALAGTPQPSITGTAPSPIDFQPNITIMDQCGGPITGGWGVYDLVGWRVGYSFVPTVTASPLGIALPVSYNGFTTFSIYAEISTDDGFGHPGVLLYTGPTVTITNPPNYPAAAQARLKFANAPVLNAGTSYVVVLRTPTGACFVDSGPGACGGVLSQSLDGGVTWTNQAGGQIRAMVSP